jgi:DNA-binding response OmpR family regulator
MFSEAFGTMKILVVDDLAGIRDPMVAAFQAAGHSAEGAANGVAALAFLKNDKPDLLLLDVQLPDMNGVQILRAIRNSPATMLLPVILLTAQESRENIESAARLGVQGYLLKNRFAMDELIACIEKFAPKTATATTARRSNEIPQLIERDQFLQRIKPVLDAAARASFVAQSISMSPNELEAALGKDEDLSSRVRGLVNQWSGEQPGRLRNLAVAAEVFRAMPAASPDGFKPVRYWQHSFAVAHLCELLASAGGRNDGMAYIVGLCHELAKIVFQTLFRAEDQKVAEYEESTGRPREELEFPMLGMTHAELIGTILHAFGLPDAVRAPIEWLHANAASPSLGSPGSLEGILRISDWYANGILLASSDLAELNLLTAARAETAIGSRNLPRLDTRQLREQILAMTGTMMGGPVEGSNPPPAGDGKRIWIARDVPLSRLDSATAAISELSRAEVMDRLPTAAEFKGIDALVVVGDKQLQDSATALARVVRSTTPTLRILPATSDADVPQSLQCPITLADIEAFCQSLNAPGAAQSSAA